MLRHVVMIQFNEKSKSLEIAHELKNKLLDLRGKIDVLLNMEVGINISNSGNAFDFVLIADFEHEADLNIYRSHPDHLQVLDFLEQISKKISVVDYFN